MQAEAATGEKVNMDFNLLNPERSNLEDSSKRILVCSSPCYLQGVLVSSVWSSVHRSYEDQMQEALNCSIPTVIKFKSSAFIARFKEAFKAVTRELQSVPYRRVWVKFNDQTFLDCSYTLSKKTLDMKIKVALLFKRIAEDVFLGVRLFPYQRDVVYRVMQEKLPPNEEAAYRVLSGIPEHAFYFPKLKVINCFLLGGDKIIHLLKYPNLYYDLRAYSFKAYIVAEKFSLVSLLKAIQELACGLLRQHDSMVLHMNIQPESIVLIVYDKEQIALKFMDVSMLCKGLKGFHPMNGNPEHIPLSDINALRELEKSPEEQFALRKKTEVFAFVSTLLTSFLGRLPYALKEGYADPAKGVSMHEGFPDDVKQIFAEALHADHSLRLSAQDLFCKLSECLIVK